MYLPDAACITLGSMKPVLCIEALESRIAPAAVVTLSLSAAGKLTVTTEDGSSPDMNISSDTAGGVTTYYLQGLNTVEDTTFKLGKSPTGITLGTSTVTDDYATIVGIKSIAINFGDGKNAVSLGNGVYGLSVPGDLSIIGGNGDGERIQVGALGNGVTVGKAFTVKLNGGSDSLDFLGTGTSSFGKTTIDLGKGTNDAPKTLGTNNTSTLTFTDALTITSGGADTKIELGFAGGSVSVAKNLMVNTASGDNTIKILGADVNVTGNLALTTKGKAVGRTNTVEIKGDTSLNVGGGVTIKGNPFSNDVSINSGNILVGRGVTITGGADNDTVVINPTIGKITGKVSVKGGKGANVTTLASGVDLNGFLVGSVSVTGVDNFDKVVIDKVTVDDNVSFLLGTGSSEVVVKNADFDGFTIKATGAEGTTDQLTIDHLDTVLAASFTYGAGDSTVNIAAYTAFANFTLKTGNGTNAMNISASAGAGLSKFHGKTSITGGTGNDTVVIGVDGIADAGEFDAKLAIALGKGTDTVNGLNTEMLAIAALQGANVFNNGVVPVVTGVTI